MAKDRKTPAELRREKMEARKKTSPPKIPWENFNPLSNFNSEGARKASQSMKKSMDRQNDTMNVDVSATDTYDATKKKLANMRSKKVKQTEDRLKKKKQENKKKENSGTSPKDPTQAQARKGVHLRRGKDGTPRISSSGEKLTPEQIKANKALANQKFSYADLAKGAAEGVKAKAKLAAAERGERTKGYSKYERLQQKLRQLEIDRNYWQSHDGPLVDEEARLKSLQSDIEATQKSLRERGVQMLANKGRKEAAKISRQATLDAAKIGFEGERFKAILDKNKAFDPKEKQKQVSDMMKQMSQDTMAQFPVEEGSDQMAAYVDLPENRQLELAIQRLRRMYESTGEDPEALGFPTASSGSDRLGLGNLMNRKG